MGKLKIVYGPMFSGKTSELIKEVEKYIKTRGEGDVLIINSELDKRPDLNSIINLSSHSNVISDIGFEENKERVIRIKTNSLMKLISPFLYTCREKKIVDLGSNDIELVVIDESQFFGDLEEFVCEMMKLGKYVICFGLISDFKMKPFGHLYKLIPMADRVVQKYSVCKKCVNEKKGFDNKAPFTSIKEEIKQDSQILVGGADMYEAVCRRHHPSYKIDS